MSEIITRFAPSPTGMLHIGNIRTALINYLYSKKYGGKFILRIDDTDIERSKKEYEETIKRDLTKLGIIWDESFNQTDKLDRYKVIQKQLLKSGRLYPCYETPEELDIKRKIQLSSGKPPIYDRAALKLSEDEKAKYEEKGRKPHYRFLIQHQEISWQDMIKGPIIYHGSNLSDPVVIRADNTMTYMLCSTIDDIDSKITHVIRGEDHVSNTAIQIQMFEALKALPPIFGHLSLVKSEAKISKRVGGHDIDSMLNLGDLHPMTINSFLTLIGTSRNLIPCKNMHKLLSEFDISHYSKSPTNYDPIQLDELNHKLILELEYAEVKDILQNLDISDINEEFWLTIRPNIQKFSEVKEWQAICFTHQKTSQSLNQEILKAAIKYLPLQINSDAWQEWTSKISETTGIKGKEMFMTLRLAITGKESGPELKNLLPLIPRTEIINRLEFYL
ncbi:MAG: glutamate--tRNA ligase [Rickettsiaceae bacterium]|nr:glutamate--tRNA ligase [Rickettsiaceae bacterium]